MKSRSKNKLLLVSIIVFILALCLSACSKNLGLSASGSDSVTTPVSSSDEGASGSNASSPDEDDPAEELNIQPSIIGLYIPTDDGTKDRKIVTTYSSERVAKTDIDVFEPIASNNALLEGSSFNSIWSNAWNSFSGVENSKIGFHISFELTDGEKISQTILKPSDTLSFFQYLEIYMYDDIHQKPGTWYSHLLDEEINDQTIITSIKLTSGEKISEVSDIRLTAFIYNGPECFDANGNYLGYVKYSITISNK